MRRAVPVVLALLVAAPPAAAAIPRKPAGGGAPEPPTTRRLAAVDAGAPALVRSRVALAALGGTPVSRALGIWRVPGSAVAGLARRGLVLEAESVTPLGRAAAAVTPSDPLVPEEWWRAAVGADSGPAPGAGRPVTVIDTGIDLAHPEFAGRPNTLALNPQTLADTPTDFHGTAVASVVGAPANGVGVVGVYPNAVLRSWDAGKLTNEDVIRGLDAASRTPGVINISLGTTTYDPLIAQAILLAFSRGSLVVAAAGNSFQEGNPLTFPASLSHVLTVAATDRSGLAAPFSSAFEAVDLAAPGDEIPVAVPVTEAPSGYGLASGTSFAAPIVSGAAAWVWTVRPALDNTQLFDLMRLTARDAGPAGFDRSTGFGVLDIPAALSRKPLPSDGAEPNDDVFEIKPGGLRAAGVAPLTRAGRGGARVEARLDSSEDPEDVYRVWVPARRRVTVSVASSTDVDLELWGPTTRSVAERGVRARHDLVGASTRSGTSVDTISTRNASGRGRFVYADVFLGRDTGSALYRLTVRTASGR